MSAAGGGPGLHPLARRSLAKLSNPIRHVVKPLFDAAAPMVFLDANENAFGGEHKRYPEVDPVEVRAAFARYLGRESARHGVPEAPGPVAPGAATDEWLNHPSAARLMADHVWVTAGSSEAIDLVIRSFCEPRVDSVCVTSPTFPMYQHWATAYDLGVVDVPLEGERYQRLAVERIVAAQAKLTFLTTPNNPHGSTLDPAEVRALLDGLDGMVAIDEAYVETAGQPSYASWLDRYPNLVIVRSFSKGWGLAGLRLGALVAAPSVVEAVCRMAAPYLVSTPALEALGACLRDPAPLEASWAELRRERARVSARLAELPVVRRVHPSTTHFVLVELERRDALVAGLEQEGILVKSLASSPRFVRVTVGRPEENDRFLAVIARL